MSPLVSVLMTAYNREQFIAQAIESVLSSSFVDFEFIIIDDNSTDKTFEIIQNYKLRDNRIQTFKNSINLGDYQNRNHAASFATGKYIKFVDSDDVIYSHGLQIMVETMEKFPTAAYGLSSVAEISKPLPQLLNPHDAYFEHFYGYGHFYRSPASAIIKREVFEQIGGFTIKKYFGDMDMWFLISQSYPMVKFQRDLVWDRVHDVSESKYESMDASNISIRSEIINFYLFHPSCPLHQEEVFKIKNRLKRNASFLWVKKILKKFK